MDFMEKFSQQNKYTKGHLKIFENDEHFKLLNGFTYRILCAIKIEKIHK